MAALRILRLGHPKLRLHSKAVPKRTIQTKRFQTFLANLAATCKQNKGVGIAAPQVGKNIRVIIVYVNKNNPRYQDKIPFPLTIIINPKIVAKEKEQAEDWEGDLSADLRALVPRAKTCIVEGIDKNGKTVRYDIADTFHARIFQHEIDHLNGILFLDKVKRKDSICETAMWRKYHKPSKQSVVSRQKKNTDNRRRAK